MSPLISVMCLYDHLHLTRSVKVEEDSDTAGRKKYLAGRTKTEPPCPTTPPAPQRLLKAFDKQTVFRGRYRFPPALPQPQRQGDTPTGSEATETSRPGITIKERCVLIESVAVCVRY